MTEHQNIKPSMRKRTEAAKEPESKKSGGGDPGNSEITPNFIKSCLNNNERGDGILYATLLKDKFLYIKNTTTWLAWTGHHWQMDREDKTHNAVEQVAELYLEQSEIANAKSGRAFSEGLKDTAKNLFSLSKQFNKRVDRLRGGKGVHAAMDWSHKVGDQSLSIVGDEIDQKPWLLPCQNGVVDLKTGKMIDGCPDDYLVRAIPVEWRGLNEPAPEWEKFIKTIHQDDTEIVDFIRRLFGYSITGLTTEHFIACFVGDGRNGKGTMFETLKALMGELAWAIQPEMLLEQKIARSANGPSADLIALQGRRLVIASETDEHRRISGARVKQLTGGDTICARAPHDRYDTNFTPTHKLYLYTNHIPHGLTKDYALYKRLLFLQYPLRFIDDPKEDNERPRDPFLQKKLTAEFPGILAWLVRGCLEWQERGMDPPKKLRADIEELRIKEDTFQQFFNEQCKADPDEDIRFKHLYEAYRLWYLDEIEDSGRWIPSKIKISEWLTKRGYKRRKPGGVATVSGLRLNVQVAV